VDVVLAGTESAARVIAEFESVAGAELQELVRAAFATARSGASASQLSSRWPAWWSRRWWWEGRRGDRVDG